MKIICQGLNYADHRVESGLSSKSSSNVLFYKDESSITGAYDNIIRPKDCFCLDYEVELGIIIKKDINTEIQIATDNLSEYVAGIILANDMSPRNLQYKDDYAQWFKAKSHRTMLPLGPILYIMNEQDFDYLDKLKIQLWVNDELRQNDSTRQMIFKPADTINEISSFMNLSAGDLILTGTPGGVIVKAPSKLKQGIATWLLTNEKKIQILENKKTDFYKMVMLLKLIFHLKMDILTWVINATQ